MSSPNSLARSFSRKLIFTSVGSLHPAPWLTLLTASDWEGADRSESQKSADMLTRIILDLDFSIHVKTVRIFVPAEREQTQSFAFQLGNDSVSCFVTCS